MLFKGGRPPCTDHGGVSAMVWMDVLEVLLQQTRGHIVASEITGIIVVYISTQNCTRKDNPF